ncbi:MAG: hypothetical protein AABY15_01950 [Nanoarchaeota archaeon]
MESNQKILDKIDEMYNLKDAEGKQKNKAFFSHLIRAYVPLHSVSVALANPEDNKIKVRCVFTKKELVTVEQAHKNATVDSLRNSIDEFVASYDKERCYFTSTTNMNQLLGGKVLGLQGKDTKTYMSQESYGTFINWVMLKYIEGDGHIKWLVNQMSKGGFHPGITVTPVKPQSNNNHKPRHQGQNQGQKVFDNGKNKSSTNKGSKHSSGKPKVYTTPGAKKITLGDLSALQELKNKFKDSE